MTVKHYKNKQSGEPCELLMEAGNFVKVFFPYNQGEGGGDDEQTVVMSKVRFFEKHEEVKNEK